MERSTLPALLWLRSSQAPPRLTPMVVVPFPSQSPATGWSAVPLVRVSRTYQSLPRTTTGRVAGSTATAAGVRATTIGPTRSVRTSTSSRLAIIDPTRFLDERLQRVGGVGGAVGERLPRVGRSCRGASPDEQVAAGPHRDVAGPAAQRRLGKRRPAVAGPVVASLWAGAVQEPASHVRPPHTSMLTHLLLAPYGSPCELSSPGSMHPAGLPGRAQWLCVSETSTGELTTTQTKLARRLSVSTRRVGYAVAVVVDALLVKSLGDAVTLGACTDYGSRQPCGMARMERGRLPWPRSRSAPRGGRCRPTSPPHRARDPGRGWWCCTTSAG